MVCGERALIHNYANNTWYYYDHFPAAAMVKVGGELYFGTPDGRVMHLSRQYRNDALGPSTPTGRAGAWTSPRTGGASTARCCGCPSSRRARPG